MTRALKGVAIALLFLLVAEGLLRASGFGGARAQLHATRDDAEAADWLVPHSERLYALRPEMRHAPAHAGYYALGTWPFRGRPAEPLPEHVTRVLMIGDSCVFGVGLHVGDTLPEQVARELAQRGIPPDRVAVINLGVPGYSTLQMARLLPEALARWRPAAVVMYPAAWNDQAPALGASDKQRMNAAASSGIVRGVRESAVVAALRSVLLPAPDAAELRAAWERGDADVRPRVEAADTRLALTAMIAACRASDATPLVVAPTHPALTRSTYPRTAADAALVTDVAISLDVSVVDAHELFGSARLSDAELFSDHVHPSALGMRLIAAEVATRLDMSTIAPPRASSLRIEAVAPREVPELGDVRLQVTLAGWDRTRALPVVTLAGAPLLDVRAESEHVISGVVMANAPCVADLVVQTESACVVEREAVTLRAATLTLIPGDPPRLRFTSRPGDRAELFVSEHWQIPPKISGTNFVFLEEASTQRASWKLEAGPEGFIERDVPEAASLLSAGYCAQAVVLPAGLEADARSRTRVKRWLAPLGAPP